MLNILPGRLQMNAVIPLAPDRTRVIFDYFYDADATEDKIENDIAFSDKVQQEDIEICEHVQRGLQSKAYDRGRFSVEMEQGVYHFQRLLKRAYRQVLNNTSLSS
jgi:choline monooxygenase